jgi:hypothetical protein
LKGLFVHKKEPVLLYEMIVTNAEPYLDFSISGLAGGTIQKYYKKPIKLKIEEL